MPPRDDRLLHVRFWSRVEVGVGDGCWLWRGSQTHDGYGRFWWRERGRYVRAHRASFILTHGEPPPDAPVIRHSCDVPLCCNPAHLLAGTLGDNNRDTLTRGRWGRTGARGERNGRAKLTVGEVQQLRELYATGRYRQIDLAQMFGVSRSAAGRAATRRMWTEAA